MQLAETLEMIALVLFYLFTGLLLSVAVAVVQYLYRRR
jgi:hypothetical protein